MRMLKLLVLCILAIPSAQGMAQDCIDTISATFAVQHYHINSNGTVSDKKNQLMWMQCSEGQQWSNGQCLGTAQAMTWDKAQQEANHSRFAKYSNWRLPTIHELSGIIELRCQQPAINLQFFPGTPSLDFWTATSFINNNDLAWRVHFGFGENHTEKKSTSAAVRLVRSINQ